MNYSMANQCVEIPISGLYRGPGGITSFLGAPPDELRQTQAGGGGDYGYTPYSRRGYRGADYGGGMYFFPGGGGGGYGYDPAYYGDRIYYLENLGRTLRNRLNRYDGNTYNLSRMRNLFPRKGYVDTHAGSGRSLGDAGDGSLIDVPGAGGRRTTGPFRYYNGVRNQVARSDHGHGGNIGNTVYRRTAEWVVPSTLAAGAEQAGRPDLWGDGNFDSSLYVIDAVTAYVKTAPTGAAILIDINYINPTTGVSTSILSGNLTIAAGAQRQTASTGIFAGAGTIPYLSDITMDIDQVGSTTAGADLSVKLHLKIATLALILSGS